MANSSDQPDGLARRRAGQQDAPQPGQEQQPDADRPVDARQQQVGQPGARQPGDPAGGDDVGVRGMTLLSLSLIPVNRHAGVMIASSPLRGRDRWPRGATIAPAAPARRIISAPCMRRAAGDAGAAVQRPGRRWQARIAAMRRDRASLQPSNAASRPQAAEADLWLVFAPLKRDATDLVVQKATELGVSALLPVLTERTNAAPDERGPAAPPSPSRPPNSASG